MFRLATLVMLAALAAETEGQPLRDGDQFEASRCPVLASARSGESRADGENDAAASGVLAAGAPASAVNAPLISQPTHASRDPTAAASQHWAFQPVRKPNVPGGADWSANPIDRFVMAKLTQRELGPVGPADRRTLIRRATFDLIGLPPTPDEVAAFLADDSPGAFGRVVERLLASPHYGERWGRHWMDVVRYADTAGDNADYPIPEIRLYRDYIIDSFNADKPYEEFVRQQLAGDILAAGGPREKYAERVAATGFIALSRRYATAPFEFHHLTIEDTIETTGRAFMGLTLRCARCHDHKFDPVTMQDYYGLYGFFASTQYPYAGSEEFQSKSFPRSGFVPLVPPAEAEPLVQVHQQRIENLRAEIKRTEQEDPLVKRVAELKQQIESRAKTIQELDARQKESRLLREAGLLGAAVQHALKQQQPKLQKEHDDTNGQLQAKLNQMRGELRNLERPGLPAELSGAYAVRDGKATDVNVQMVGDPARPGPLVRRGVPKFLGGDEPRDIADGSSGRLELARWLTRPDHPLTARVMVNRIWQHHFGKGIVGTPSNFGLRGDEPSHPELLDWLAAEFVERGWSIKSMHRLIMTSQTYQLASTHDEAGAAADPGNQWYWRFDRRRLDAESIRDAMLATSGKLTLQRPGAHPFPTFDKWNWTQHQPFKAVYPSNHRSVYLMTQRIQRHPYLALFDGPDPNYSTDVRTSATVPLQALFMMNSPFVQDQAKGLTQRLLAAAVDVRERVELAHELAYGRPAKPVEQDKAADYLERYQQELTRAGVTPDQIALEAWSSYARVILTANEFMYVD